LWKPIKLRTPSRGRFATNPHRDEIATVPERGLARFDRQDDHFAAKAPGFVEGEGFADRGQRREYACHPRTPTGPGDFHNAGNAHGILRSEDACNAPLRTGEVTKKAVIAAFWSADRCSASDDKWGGRRSIGTMRVTGRSLLDLAIRVNRAIE
jgi:hypothetical protein